MQNSHTRSSVSVKFCCLSLLLNYYLIQYLFFSPSLSLTLFPSKAVGLLQKKIANRFSFFCTFLVFPGQLRLPAYCFNSDGDTASSCEQLNINTSLTSILFFPP